jgi:hypothetical protein
VTADFSILLEISFGALIAIPILLITKIEILRYGVQFHMKKLSRNPKDYNIFKVTGFHIFTFCYLLVWIFSVYNSIQLAKDSSDNLFRYLIIGINVIPIFIYYYIYIILRDS